MVSAASLFVEAVLGDDRLATTAELGLVRMAVDGGSRVGFFRPVAEGEGTDDARTALMRGLFDGVGEPAEMFGVTREECMAKLAKGQEDELLDAVVAKYEAYKARFDFVLVSGITLESESHDWNTRCAATLSAPMALLGAMDETRSEQSLYRALSLSKQELVADKVQLAGFIAAGVPSEDVAQSLRERFAADNTRLLAAIPRDARLTSRSVSDVLEALDAEVLFGHDLVGKEQVNDVLVAASSLDEILSLWKKTPQALLLCHTSRTEIIMSVLLAMQTGAFPRLAAICLTGDKDLTPGLLEVLKALEAVPLPVLHSKVLVYEAVKRIERSGFRIHHENMALVEVAESHFEQGCDKAALRSIFGAQAELDVTPKLFQYRIFTSARADPQRIVLPEGEDIRVLRAAEELHRRGLCQVTVLGDPAAIASLAARNNLKLPQSSPGFTIVHPPTAPDFGELVARLVELREKKGMTTETAEGLLRKDFNWYGTMLMEQGLIDGMVSGACHTTAETMRPALSIIKTAPGFNLVSSIFFMLLPERVQVFGDCAIVVDPTEEQLAEIAVTSARTATAFGIKPRVALLSYSTGNSGSGVSIDKVKHATEKARTLDGGLTPIEGPIQFDAAVDPAVATVKFKGAENPVAGKASVLVFPDLNAGNNAYKAVQQASGCVAMGPIMQGMRLPVNDLSRGCTTEDIVNTVVVTCVQAQQCKSHPME